MPWRILHILGKRNKVGRLEAGITSDAPWLGLCQHCLGCRCEHQELPVPPRAGHPAVCLGMRGRVRVAVPAAPWFCSGDRKPALQGGRAGTCQGELWAFLPALNVGKHGGWWLSYQPQRMLDSHGAKTELGDIFHLRLFIPGEKKKKKREKNPLLI